MKNIAEELKNELEEIIDFDGLELLIKRYNDTGEKINIYWGTAPTGIPSIGYYEPLRIIAKLVKYNCFNITILFADLHAYLDSEKSSLETVKYRTEVYKIIITNMLKTLRLDDKEISLINFIVGSTFQLTPEYQLDLFKLGNITTIKDAQHAGAEVVKLNKNPLLTSLQYVLMQALDEKYLKADCQLGGHDQRRIMMYARDFMPKIKNKKCVQLMNKLIPGISFTALDGKQNKMSSSDKSTKISVIDTEKDIKKKINKTYCVEKNIDDNTLLELLKNLLFPVLDVIKEDFVINRSEKYGGKIEYTNYDNVHEDWVAGKLHPADLKLGISELIFKLAVTEPINELLLKNAEY